MKIPVEAARWARISNVLASAVLTGIGYVHRRKNALMTARATVPVVPSIDQFLSRRKHPRRRHYLLVDLHRYLPCQRADETSSISLSTSRV